MKATTPRAGWANKKLNELGFVGRGKSKHRPRNDARLYGGQYPFVQTADIMGSEFYITRYSKTYSEIGLAQSRLWHKDTLCITIAGENTAESAILSFTACFPDSVVGFIADSEKSDVRFVKYYLDTIKRQIKSITRGATQDNLSLEKLLSFDILTPPLPTQRKIAAILSAYDDLIENNTRRIKILEEMARLLYREWFVHFRFPGHDKVKMVKGVPEGWASVRVGDRFTTVLGGTPSRNRPEFWEGGTIPWINSSKANELRVLQPSEYITQEGLERSNTKVMPKRTTLIAITGATLGQVSLLEIEACANQSVVGVYDTSNLHSEFIYLTFEEIINEVIQHASGGAQQHINKEIVNAVRVSLPTEKLALRFREVIVPVFDGIANLMAKNANLRRTRDLLLPRLVSGEVDVERLEISGVDSP